MYRGSTLIPLFDEAVSRDFQERTLRCLFQAYRDAELICRELYRLPEFRRDTVAYVRRTLFDDAWIRLAKRHPTLDARAAANSSKNCSHARIQVPGRVCWTASLVESPRTLVRHAVFRQDYAEQAQGDLFRTEKPRPGLRVYALLLHGHDDDLSRPKFARVAFPDRECSMYFNSLDLRRRFPHVGTESDQAAAEHIDEEVVVRIREAVRTRVDR